MLARIYARGIDRDQFREEVRQIYVKLLDAGYGGRSDQRRVVGQLLVDDGVTLSTHDDDLQLLIVGSRDAFGRVLQEQSFSSALPVGEWGLEQYCNSPNGRLLRYGVAEPGQSRELAHLFEESLAAVPSRVVAQAQLDQTVSEQNVIDRLLKPLASDLKLRLRWFAKRTILAILPEDRPEVHVPEVLFHLPSKTLEVVAATTCAMSQAYEFCVVDVGVPWSITRFQLGHCNGEVLTPRKLGLTGFEQACFCAWNHIQPLELGKAEPAHSDDVGDVDDWRK